MSENNQHCVSCVCAHYPRCLCVFQGKWDKGDTKPCAFYIRGACYNCESYAERWCEKHKEKISPTENLRISGRFSACFNLSKKSEKRGKLPPRLDEKDAINRGDSYPYY